VSSEETRGELSLRRNITWRVINAERGNSCVVERLLGGDKIKDSTMASASATLLKSSPVLDKCEWVKGQTLRQPLVRCNPSSASALTIKAASYADELVKTAVCY